MISVGRYTGSAYKNDQTKIVSSTMGMFEIFEEPVQSKISSATVNALKEDIENMEKNLASAKANLKKAEVELKKNIPALVVGGLYVAPAEHNWLWESTILIWSIDDNEVQFIQFNNPNADNIERFTENVDDINDGTLIHLNSAEDKKFAKRLIELTKNFSF